MQLKKVNSNSNKIDLIYVVDGRALERECFVRGIEIMQPNTTVEAFSSAAEWLEIVGAASESGVILYSTQGRRVSDTAVSSDLAQLAAATGIPIIILSPIEEIGEMIAALEIGARGYIPASLGIEATLTAIQLSSTDTIFMRAASLLAMRDLLASQTREADITDTLTSRQSAVADALRRGKPNKLIAYELNMCESTVKVHIRNIMKKLHAKNRTEASCKLNNMRRTGSV